MRLLTAILFFGLLAGCTPKDDEKTFSYAVSGEFKPFSYVNNKGELTGFDVELGRLIAEQLNQEPRVVKYKFSGIIEGLKTGRFDAAVASHTVTEERKKHVNFSKPYYYSGPQVFSREASESVDLKDKEIAVSKGSTYQRLAREHTEEVKVYDSDNTALEALAQGRHDLVITDFVTGAMAIKSGLKIESNQRLGSSQQAVAIAKSNPELLKSVNSIIENLKQQGALKKLSEKYFNTDISKQ